MTTNETQDAGTASASTDELNRLRREVRILNETLRKKNLALDALHYVWCNGGCEGGVHRWVDAEVTEELVAEAERNTKRLRTWLTNYTGRRIRFADDAV